MKPLALRAGLAAIAIVGAISYPVGRAVAATEFLAYEGRDSVQEGQGGNKKVINGVDFWVFGTPPHRFQVLGMISDERWASGIYGLIQVANIERDIAKRAQLAGGDAVILQDSHNNVWGISGSTFGSASWGSHSAFGSSFSTESPYGTRATRYIVVKYLPDGAGPGEPAQPSSSAAPLASSPPSEPQFPAGPGANAPTAPVHP
jgi:hypothetical protein